MTWNTAKEKEARREEWFKTQPKAVKLNSMLVEGLGENLAKNSPMYVASYLADCLKQKVWEEGWWDVKADGEYYAHTCGNAIEFIRERCGMEPSEMMNIIASPLPKAEDGAAAAIELIKELKTFEPKTFALVMDESNPSNWRDLLVSNEKRVGGPWIEATAELDRTARSLTRPIDTELLEKVKKLYEQLGTIQKVADELGRSKTTIQQWLSGRCAPYLPTSQKNGPSRAEINNGPGTYRAKTRRRLERYAADAELCKEAGTTQAKVKEALFHFMDGKPGQWCERHAGLARKSQTQQLRIASPAPDVANRIIQLVKPAKAKAIAEAILNALPENS